MVGGGDEVDLTSVLATLSSKKSSLDDKIEAYTSLSSHFKEDELSFVHLDVTKHANRVLAQLKKDILHDCPAISQNALQILGFCLHDQETIRFISAADAGSLLKSLCGVVEQAEDKETCTRALWCVGTQALAGEVVAKQIPTLLSSCEKALSKWKGQSATVEDEIVCVVARLLDQVPKPMADNSFTWVKLLVPMAVHPAVEVREKVIDLFEKNLAMLTSLKGLAHTIAGDFKTKISLEMKKLFTSSPNELLMLRLWKVVVTWFGEELHRGTSLINQLLSIAELGFKHPSVEVKVASFEAWRTLIDNFATNPTVLSDVKRIKLIMQVLKLNNKNKEAVAKAQFDTWWHFIKLLGPKASVYFEQVITPLFSFCLGGTTKLTPHTPNTPLTGLKSAVSSPLTPRLNLSNSGPPSLASVSLQKKGCQVLARILASPKTADGELQAPVFGIDELPVDVITGPAMFLKHATLLIHSATELICSVGADIPQFLLMYIWQSLARHMCSALTATAKSDNRDAFSLFLEQFHTIVASQVLSHQMILSMFKVVCSLPQKALSSTAYNIKTGESGEIVRGTPALYLCEVLLTPTLLKACSGLESYMTCYSQLVNCGVSNATGVLEFCQAVTDLVDRHADSAPNPEAMWRLWSIVANTLHQHILKTNEVNQGDSLEYNFSCLYTVLLLPVKHRMGSKMSSAVSRTLVKTWSDLYDSFARLAALVPTARANAVCDEFAHAVNVCLHGDHLKDVGLLDFLAQICEVIVNSVDFSSFGSSFTFNSGAPSSPSKWLRKKKPMENLQAFVVLLSKLVHALVQLSTSTDSSTSPRQKGGSTLTAAANEITDVLTTLFTHVNTSSIISNMLGHLSPPLGQLFDASAGRSNRLYSPAFLQKLEKLWLDISTCVQSRYSMPYDSDFLSNVSPLLEANFLHPRRQIKKQTVVLWNATFSHSAPLTYPEELAAVLARVRDKTMISLPGFVAPDAVIEETPLSQFVQGDSQAPEPHIPGLPSPRKIVGSFLNKAVSPNVKKSPAKLTVLSPKAISSVKKKLKVDDFRDGDFVVISTTPKKKRVLTEHQKEVLKEKKTLPVMYSSLDASMDTTLMSNFIGSDTQQDSSSLSQTLLPNSVISINSTQSEDNEKKSKADPKRLSSDFTNILDLPLDTSATVDSQEVPVQKKKGRRQKFVTFDTDDNTNNTKTTGVKTSDKSAKAQSKTTEKCDSKEKKTSKMSKKSSVVVIQETEEMDGSQESSVESKKSGEISSEEIGNDRNNAKNKGEINKEFFQEYKKYDSKNILTSGDVKTKNETIEIKNETAESNNESKKESSDEKDLSLESNKSRKKLSDSSDDIAASDSLKQNLLQAMGCSIFDVFGNKSTTASSSPEETLSSETVPSGGEKSVSTKKSLQNEERKSVKTRSQDESTNLRSSVPDAEMGKHTPEKKNNAKKIIHKQLSPVSISFSQEEVGSHISPGNRMELSGRKSLSQEALSSVKSPVRKTRSRLKSLPAGTFCLDAWLVKSPVKASSTSKEEFKTRSQEAGSNSKWRSSPFHSLDDSSHGQPELDVSNALVEDTQSPTKFMNASDKVPENPQGLVEETPVKETHAPSSDPLGLSFASRSLFGEESVNGTSQPTDCSSPQNISKDVASISLKSPILCIPKLTPEKVEQICHGNSFRKVTALNGIDESDDKEKQTAIQCSQGFCIDKPDSDIPDINKTLSFTQHVVRSNSQTSTNSLHGCSAILSMEQREELKETSEPSSLDGPQCSMPGTLQKSDPLSPSIVEDHPYTEEMFSQETGRKEIKDSEKEESDDSYDPQLVSTLKDSLLKSSSSISFSQGSSQGSHSSSASFSKKSSQENCSESSTYDPTGWGTFLDENMNSQEACDKQVDSDLDLKEGGCERKRKQNFPKKVSPSKLRRTHRSRRKSKCRHGGSCCIQKSNDAEKNDLDANCEKTKTVTRKSSSQKSARSSLKFDILGENKPAESQKSEKSLSVCNQSLESDLVNLQELAGETPYLTAKTETPDKGKKSQSVKLITGEETPDSRPPLVNPVRISTTKHKLEEAKKRSTRKSGQKGTSLSEGLDFENMLSQPELQKKKLRKSLCMKNNSDASSDGSVSNGEKRIRDVKKIKKNSIFPLSNQRDIAVAKELTSDVSKCETKASKLVVIQPDHKVKHQFESLISSESSEPNIPLTTKDDNEHQKELPKSPKSVTSLRRKENQKIISSPLSLRLRSSKLVLRARHKGKAINQSPKFKKLKRTLITSSTKTTVVKDKDNLAKKINLSHAKDGDIVLPVDHGCEPVPEHASKSGIAEVTVIEMEDVVVPDVKSDNAVIPAEPKGAPNLESAHSSETNNEFWVAEPLFSLAGTSDPKTASILDPEAAIASEVSKNITDLTVSCDEDDGSNYNDDGTSAKLQGGLECDRSLSEIVTNIISSLATDDISSVDPKLDAESKNITAALESNTAPAAVTESTNNPLSAPSAEDIKCGTDSSRTEADPVITDSDCDKAKSALTGDVTSFLPPLDETPKKYKNRKIVIFPHRVVSSDSKLHVFARSQSKYSDRGMSIVRRSILKHQASDQTSISPYKRSHDLAFHPIRVNKIFSPSASPSAGILKRRFLHQSLPVDSPSPPEKERRVSFAEPVVSGESPKTCKHWKSSRDASLTGSAGEVDISRCNRNPEPGQSTSSPGSELTQSTGSYKSTQESQLDSKEPVYPDLIGCTESVAKVLPQLTSSMWSRGLVQLVKARNINTVGDLCSLSELEIHNLPIRSPKVVTVRRALQEMEQQIAGRKTRAGGEELGDQMFTKSLVEGERVMSENKENLNKLDSIVEMADERDPLPSADDALLALGQKDSEDLNSSIEEGDDSVIFENNTSVFVCEDKASAMSCDQINQSGSAEATIQSRDGSPGKMDSSPLASMMDDSTPTKVDCTSIKKDSFATKMDASTSITDYTNSKMDTSVSKMNSSSSGIEMCRGGSLVGVLEDLVERYATRDIERLRTADLFSAHHHLASLTNMVVSAMKKRCSSPPNAQE